jgi:DNA-binding MarR family transcriptional regulator
MNLTPNMKWVLRAVLEDVERLESMPDRPGSDMGRDAWRAVSLERQEFRQFGVRHDLERRLGYPPSRADSAVFSRALQQMEDLGLLVRVNRWGPSSRATHVRLTPRGEEIANSLLAKGEVDDLPKPLNLDEVEFLPIDPLDTAADGTATKEDAHDARA